MKGSLSIFFFLVLSGVAAANLCVPHAHWYNVLVGMLLIPQALWLGVYLLPPPRVSERVL